MVIERRAFLFGLAAVLASPAIASGQKYMGAVATGTLHPALRYRAVCDMMMASMPSGEEIRSPDFREQPVHYRFMRGKDDILSITLNPRASFRWVALHGEEIVLPNDELLSMAIEPCHSITTLTMVSNAEPNRLLRPRLFSEIFEWRDGVQTHRSISAFDPVDAPMLKAGA